jgi:hypothetical protein
MVLWRACELDVVCHTVGPDKADSLLIVDADPVPPDRSLASFSRRLRGGIWLFSSDAASRLRNSVYAVRCASGPKARTGSRLQTFSVAMAALTFEWALRR